MTNLITAGCYVVRVLEGPHAFGHGMLPQQVLTLSSCLTELFPSVTAFEWASCSEPERIADAAKFGIRAASVPELMRTMTDAAAAGKVDGTAVWNSLDDARAAAHQFDLDSGSFALLELGVPDDLVPELLIELQLMPDDLVDSFAAALRTGAPLRDGGVALGWELLGAELGGEFHSWLCNSLEEDAAKQLGVRPGPFGLLATEHEARAVAGLIAAGLGAEPVPWFPGLLIRHPWQARV